MIEARYRRTMAILAITRPSAISRGDPYYEVESEHTKRMYLMYSRKVTQTVRYGTVR